MVPMRYPCGTLMHNPLLTLAERTCTGARMGITHPMNCALNAYTPPPPTSGVEETRRTVAKLVDQFMDGDIRLPEMQRKYVWTREKVRALVDSLYKGYPSGSILLWETGKRVPTHPPAAVDAGRGAKRPTLLLDGQQRITSLAAVITGTPVQMRVGKSVKAARVEVYFNVDHPDSPTGADSQDDDYGGGGGAGHDDGADAPSHRVFRLGGKAAAGRPWVPVTDAFKKGAFRALTENGIVPDDPNFEKYITRLTRLVDINKYQYPVQILESGTPYPEVTDIFVRLNSQGSKLRKVDLALAQVTVSWRGAMKVFADASAGYRQKGFALDEGFLLKCLVSVSTHQNTFESIDRIGANKLKADWRRARRGLDFAIDFLKRNAGIETTDVLPSLFALVPIVCLAVKSGYAFSRPVERKILKWLYAALIWGRYSRGATETILDEDLALVRGAADPVGEMIKRVLRQSGRLEVTAGDLAGKTKQSALYSLMYVLAKKAGARDWGSGLALGIDDDHDFRAMGRQVFPRAAVVSALRQKHGARGAGKLAGDIGNAVFCLGHAAGSAGGRPEDYLPKIVRDIGADALEAQCVPANPDLWIADRYEDFLAARREGLAAAINALVEPGRPAPPKSCLVAIAGGESMTVELKSSMLYDYKRGGAKNPELKKALLKEIVALMNTEGGTVYVGVDDGRQILGIERDFALLGRRAGWDKWSLDLTNAVKTLGAAAARNVSCERAEIDGKAIAKIVVRRGASPAYLDPAGRGEFVMRSGSASVLLSTKEATEYIRDRFPGSG